MDDIRAQLNALMGEDRDVPLSERDKRRPHRRHSDPEVCKYFLCGFCPYEEFRRTKNDQGDCPLIHDEKCRAEYEGLDERDKARCGYEADLLLRFDRLLGDLRKRIDANARRLESADKPAILAEDQQRLDNLTQQMNLLLARAAELGEHGDVDGAQAAAADAERLRMQRASAEAAAQGRALARVGGNLHQKVCPISGLIINDEESRLQDHYAGRNYNSWKKLHEVHARILERQQQRCSSLHDGGRLSSGRDDRDRRRERSRSRDGRRKRSRSRERRRERSRSRSAGRRRERSRSRDRRRDERGSSRRDERGGRDERDRRRDDRRDDRRGSDRHREQPVEVPAEPEDVVYEVEWTAPAAAAAAPAKAAEVALPALNIPPPPGTVSAAAAAPAKPAVANTTAAAMGAADNLLPVPAGPARPDGAF